MVPHQISGLAVSYSLLSSLVDYHLMMRISESYFKKSRMVDSLSPLISHQTLEI
jgi:hypothetical protein